jgi:hypothetical protein
MVVAELQSEGFKQKDNDEIGDVDSIANDLEDAEAAAALDPKASMESNIEVEAFQTFLVNNNNRTVMSMMLHMSFWERIRWRFGKRLAPQELGYRIFSFIDLNKDGCLPIGVLDVLVKYFQTDLGFNKATMELVEV